jgi:hypothetical protein
MELLPNFESIMGRQVIRLMPYLDLQPEDAMKMCRLEIDCHPSPFGMKVYADAVTKIVQERLKR